jgi:hypothetical protein
MKHIIFSKKTPIILGIVVLLLCVAMYFIFTDIKKKNEHVSILDNELSLDSHNQEYLHSMNKMIQDSNSDIARLNDSVLASDGDIDFIENLEKLAHDNNLSIEIGSLGFTDDTMIKSDSFTFLKVDAHTKGSWVGTYAFIASLEALPLKVRIDKFTFSKMEDKNGADTESSIKNAWQSNFEIRILKYK